MSSFHKEKLSIEEKGLRYKLLIIETLVFLLPFSILFYIFYKNGIFLKSSQIVIFILSLVLILAGLIILRQIFERILMMAASMKKAGTGDQYLTDIKKDTAELHEITGSFNSLIKKYQDTASELKQRVFELFAIKELTEVASKILDIEGLLKILLEKAMAVSKAQTGSVLMLEPEKERFRVVASWGLEPGLAKGSYININESLARLVVSEKKNLLVQDIEADERIQKPNDPKYGPPSFLSMPVFTNGNLLAVLNLANKQTEQVFDSSDEQILSIMIGEIGFALENAMLHSKTEEHLKDLQDRTKELTDANNKLQQEVTERKRAEEALRESEERFKSLSDNAPDIIYALGSDGSFNYVNSAWQRILGHERKEVIGKYFTDFSKEEDASKYFRSFKRIRDKKETLRDAEVTIIHRDGSARLFNTSCSPNINAAGEVTGVVGIFQDITEQRELEARLQQAQKMEAIGTLAGGITHDFNNILGAIIGYTELATLNLPEGSNAKKYLIEVKKAGDRAKDLVNHILAFSRQTEQKIITVRIGSIVKEALKMLRASLPSTIEIRQKIESNLGSIDADPTQIHQVLMNLCTNAAHAMQENGGVLEVMLGNMDIDAGFAGQHGDISPGPFVKLTVRDTGHGMAPEVLKRIFDPYFTTKQKGEGTGMGLAVVSGIMKSHGRIITVESELGKGTTFHGYFPRGENAKEGKETKVVESLPTGDEHILFIDDEETLADMGKQMLAHLGYKVTTRTSSIEALELFRAQPDKFDIVITDMTMPNMTGEKLAKELMRIRPNIPIILCTGFSERISEEETKNIGIQKFIMKPIVMSDLAKTIREAFGSEK